MFSCNISTLASWHTLASSIPCQSIWNINRVDFLVTIIDCVCVCVCVCVCMHTSIEAQKYEIFLSLSTSANGMVLFSDWLEMIKNLIESLFMLERMKIKIEEDSKQPSVWRPVGTDEACRVRTRAERSTFFVTGEAGRNKWVFSEICKTSSYVNRVNSGDSAICDRVRVLGKWLIQLSKETKPNLNSTTMCVTENPECWVSACTPANTVFRVVVGSWKNEQMLHKWMRKGPIVGATLCNWLDLVGGTKCGSRAVVVIQ